MAGEDTARNVCQSPRHVPLPIRVSVAEHASQRTAIQARPRAIARRASKSVSRNESSHAGTRRANACAGLEIDGDRKTVIGTTAGQRYSNARSRGTMTVRA